MQRRGLQVVLVLLGVVAVTAGGLSLLTGGALVPDAGEVSASIDSELRFYSAWYVAAGVLLLRAVARVETEVATVRLVGAALFLAACSRVLSMATVGMPHPWFVALTIIEFLIPLVIIPWQAVIVRGTRGPASSPGACRPAPGDELP